MYQACRHIKPSGERCKSPAIRGHSFCYFHARDHRRTTLHNPRVLSFPVPEDFAAIQESIAKVFDCIVNDRIEPTQSSRILWGLQIALQTIRREPTPPTDSVQEVTLSKRGDELAPPLEISSPALETASCEKALPSHAGFDPAGAAANLATLETARAKIVGSIKSEQLLIGNEKLLRYLDNPNR